MKLKINVDSRFINKGVRNSTQSCPIALAVEEAFCSRTGSVSFGVCVAQNDMMVTNHTKKGIFFYRTKLPQKLKTFARKFDLSPNKISTPPAVKPFEYIIELKREKYDKTNKKHNALFD